MKELWAKIRMPVLVITTVLAFSALEVVANPIRNRIDPFAMTFWRFLLGGLFLLPPAVRRIRKKARVFSWKVLAWLTVLGVLNIIVGMGAHALSVKYAKASTAAILIAANPIVINLFGWVLLGELLSWRRSMTLILGFCGVLLVAARPAVGEDTGFGIAAGLIGMAAFSLYTVLSKKFIRRLGSLVVTVVTFFTASVVFLPLLLLAGVKIWPEPDVWLRLLILGFVVSGLGYYSFFKILNELPAGRTSLLFFAKPPVAIILAWLLLGESVAPGALVGTAL
ncbi:MAG TPA: EamA family transporter, partial [Candidatus Ozemobacteraceae bacterium]|nr:EamA family transporter [Candidatus Ozemobacteraceae bacterium]